MSGESVTLKSSATGTAFTLMGLVMFVAVAATLIVLNGVNIATGAVSLLAGFAAVVMLLDLPLGASFDASGVRRSTPLRHVHIEWGEIDRLVRMRRAGVRLPGSPKHSGIVAVCGSRRIMLVDRTETAAEHAVLWVLLGESLAEEQFESLVQSSGSGDGLGR